MTPVRLGEFEVLEPLARGGMGEVWTARHPGQDVPVAIKVMAEDLAEQAKWRDRFRSEVRAMAQLEHSGVVWVFDYGEIPPEVAAAAGGALPAGAPWVAMEYASAGTVDARIGSLRWAGVRALVLSLLDTLAHAHARKVIHRDIKPANILLCSASDLRPGPKLTDFGIAASLDEDTTSEGRMIGTPSYMAPEQILALRTDLGPWTDLYALGCVVWELVSGLPPFDNADRSQVLFSHLSSPLPDFHPKIAVPAELQSWLETCLAKAPDRRFSCAADAAHALRAFTEIPEEEPEDPALVTILRSTAHSTLPLTRSSGRTGGSGGHRATWFDDTTLTEASAAYDTGHSSSQDWPLPGMPLDWRRSIPVRRSRQLQGAGLGLVGLRAVPLAGRELERDALWQTLVAVNTDRRARAVVLRGPAGTGKSRLARWLGERAHEVGSANFLVARHTEGELPGEGVAAALRQALRTADRVPGQRKARLVEILGEGLGDTVCAWLHPEDEPDRTIASQPERHAMVAAVLEELGRDRSVVLHLDDVQHSDDAIRLVDYLVARQRVRPSPVLVVLTAREEALARVPRTAARLDALEENPDVARLTLEALEGSARVGLLEGLLALDSETAERVLARAGGNPLFAVQLVGEWAARGWLVSGRRGFRLDDPARAEEATSLGALWRPRIEETLEGLLPDAGPWLERLALAEEALDLGRQEALAAGLDLGIDSEGLRRELVDRLCEARLAVVSEGRFRFVHGLVRDTLRERAAEGGRLAAHHGALADQLLAGPEPDPVAVAEHLLAAGRAEEAVGPLMAGLPEFRQRHGARAGMAACELAERVLDAAAVSAEAPDRGRLELEAIRARQDCGEATGPESLAALEALLADCETHGWPDALRFGATLDHGKWLTYAGELDRAEAVLEALEADPGCDDRTRAEIFYWRYALGEFRNDMDLSRRWGLLAAALFEALGDPVSAYRAAGIRGVLGFMFGDVAEAEPWLMTAAERVEATGSVGLQARARHNVGKVHWYRGRLEQAERALVEAEALYLQAGSVNLAGTRLVLTLVKLAQGQHAEALQLCRELAELAGGAGDVSVQILELAALGGLEQWEGFEARFAAIQEGLRARGRANGEDATALELIGRIALDQGRREIARMAWEEALDHWSRHDKREHEEAKVRGWLGELDGV